MASESAPYDPHVGLEAWRYTGAGRQWIIKYTGKYGEERWDGIYGGAIFHVSPAERHRNSEKVKDPANDPFRNGTFVPVTLTEHTPAEDRAAIEANPELLADDKMMALLKAGGVKGDLALAEVLAKISNMITLGRIFEAAQEANVTLSKMAMINARIVEVSEVDPETGRRMIPVTNEVDAAELYGTAEPKRATSRGVVGVKVSN